MEFTAIPYDSGRMDAYSVWLHRASDLHQDFRRVDNDPVAWTPVTKSLRTSRIALLTTAGVYQRGDEPFDELSEHGDPTFRVVPAGTPASSLAISHAHYSHSDADQDPNCIFPIDRVRRLVRSGTIASEASEHYGFMGFNPNPANLVAQATAVARRLRNDDVDVAILSPG